MKKPIIIIVITLAVLAGGAYLIYSLAIRPLAGGPAVEVNTASPVPGVAPEKSGREEAALKSQATPEAIAEIAGYQYTESYTQPAYGFSFKYPKDFFTSEIPNEASDVILVQNTAKNIGAQIMISPFPGGETDLTADFIKSEIPDLKISEPREVLIGSGQKGLAFISDNADFGGKSSEIWFIFNGRFYQLSAYAESGGFLSGLFETWQFGE